jgi:hypothetical protein
VTHEAGRRIRTYIPDNLHEHVKTMVRNMQQRTSRKPCRKSERSRGRPTHFPTIMREALSKAGYTVKGKEIKRNLKTFFTLKACGARYHFFLSPELQETIGSPDNLQRISVRAESLLKSSNRTKQKLTYDRCFLQAVGEYIKKDSEEETINGVRYENRRANSHSEDD